MARIRTIKPEFWTDSKTGTLTEFSKCLFLGLLNHCDDYGVIEWAPEEWQVKIFPYRSSQSPEPSGEIRSALLDELLSRGLAQMFSFEPDGKKPRQYLFITNFTKHQVVSHPGSPLLPGWKKGDCPDTYAIRMGAERQEINGDASVTNKNPPEDSGVLHPERKGKERSNTRARKAARPSPSPLPDDFGISERVRTWAKEKGFTKLEEHLDAFLRKAKAKGYTYVDWDAAFMEAVREDWAKLRSARNGAPPPERSRFEYDL